MATKKSNYSVLSIPGKKAGECKIISVGDLKIAFRWCPAGTFLMGSLKGEKGRDNRGNIETQHQVTLTKGFWIMETLVTVGMFEMFVDKGGYKPKGKPWIWKKGIKCKPNSEYSWDNPGYDQDNSYPVTCIRWEAAKAFCDWLEDKTGLTMRLPTEAEWEYACRAGTTEPFSGNVDEMAWHPLNSGMPPHPHSVATKKPNAWGIYDMHGNVWEWCYDWYEEFSNKSVTDPTGPKKGKWRIVRGGSWASDGVKRCRSASRCGYWCLNDSHKYSSNYVGFRVVCECKQQ